ncbi:MULTISPECIES: hypothetical protein [Microcoleaceae]|uniref:hypothetical protein n=1 Tax=Microcoleaceae TaxID=1892252 RepID=UPI0018815347|nr:hypothetical protein [Tychonema sp. LEGE 06208]MBE9162131.1 hypothetical protein [Tychonema sp. LEGE 06208]
MKQNLGLSLVLQSIFLLLPPLPVQAAAVGFGAAGLRVGTTGSGLDAIISGRSTVISRYLGWLAIGRDASCPILELRLIYQT